jgi:hypothetical protein
MCVYDDVLYCMDTVARMIEFTLRSTPHSTHSLLVSSDEETVTSPVAAQSESADTDTGTAASLDKQSWKKMPFGITNKNTISTSCCRQIRLLKANPLILIVSLLIWAVMCGAGVALCVVFENDADRVLRDQAFAIAVETGAWFSDQLDQAILPLFSLAQFATELQQFHSLPASIGAAGEPDSLPFLTTGSFRRNVTGVCDEPALVERFTKIAATIKKRANMEGVLVNLQLAPHGVICLLHPMNNTEDFADGIFMDNSGVWGLDILNDPAMKFIAEASVPKDDVVIAGPRRLTQCKDESCDATVEQAFIARLPIEVEDHDITVNGIAYKRWGFATALINWAKLVERSGVYETFAQRRLEFQLTRRDFKFNAETDSYDQEVSRRLAVVQSQSQLQHVNSRVSFRFVSFGRLWC